MDIIDSLKDFHFLRPLWLLALPLLGYLIIWLAKRRAPNSNWAKIIDPELLPRLGLGNIETRSKTPWPWLTLAWSLAVIALAGPSWERMPSSAYRDAAAWVIVLDLSPSMTAADLTPNRITRARYAINDLLDAAQDARIGLVVFSDESHTVAPLTDDVATVRALLPPLSPDIMPSSGDNLAPALDQAEKLLQQTAVKNGHIVILSDGFTDPAAALSTAERIKSKGVTLSVVGIGTKNGAPLSKADGSFAQDAQGQIRLTHLDTDRLQHLAAVGGGRYVDLAQLPELISELHNQIDRTQHAQTAVGVQVDHWRDAGIWILPGLLLLVACLSRRGWL